MESIHFEEVITLGQFLKHEGIIGTGGEAKLFLAEYEVILNGVPEDRRGKKLQNGDEIDIGGFGHYRIVYPA
ncbi:RNA-binding S4 domain-containing protein [Salinicoccus albus]|uniref:RNA-binding S4 domain-containing protein n=1 Tax=Salinicoccus albus TaxID=418756 RepID=UPI000372D958|nr:RNA-binding S4 domain-containing protein [Salinicoccus albus]